MASARIESKRDKFRACRTVSDGHMSKRDRSLGSAKRLSTTGLHSPGLNFMMAWRP
jgi:hypothetical protein